MNGNRSKGAWVWVAMVAISFASLARVQSGVENARAYADPVIKFFAASSQADSDASVRADHSNSLTRAGAYGIDLNLLPVFFVGLVAPLTLQSEPVGLCLKRTPAAQPLSTLFQRPPPFSLA
jgi:hypothetical protein